MRSIGAIAAALAVAVIVVTPAVAQDARTVISTASKATGVVASIRVATTAWRARDTPARTTTRISPGRAQDPAPQAQAFSCEVTKPNDVGILGHTDRGSYGNGLLSVGPFGLWPDGTVVFRTGGPGFTTRDGALGMKFGWRRGIRGRLTIEGRRLDAPALPLRADISEGSGDVRFVATYLVFSTPGCWEVTGRVGHTSLTFVTNVVKLGEGPGRYDPPGIEQRPASE
jgi:hypothetical protein